MLHLTSSQSSKYVQSHCVLAISGLSTQVQWCRLTSPLNEEKETWVSKLWPSWGDEDEDDFLPDNEKRFRVRIKPSGELISKVYLDYPNGKKNNSKEAQKVLKIINEYLK